MCDLRVFISRVKHCYLRIINFLYGKKNYVTYCDAWKCTIVLCGCPIQILLWNEWLHKHRLICFDCCYRYMLMALSLLLSLKHHIAVAFKTLMIIIAFLCLGKMFICCIHTIILHNRILIWIIIVYTINNRHIL